jgi:hypothetical protein
MHSDLRTGTSGRWRLLARSGQEGGKVQQWCTRQAMEVRAKGAQGGQRCGAVRSFSVNGRKLETTSSSSASPFSW